MATYEVYVGGPSTANYSRAMFPAPAFNAALPAFTSIRPAAHKGATGFALGRVLDTKQAAFAEFLRTSPPAQGDVLGTILIPQDTIFKGLYYRLDTPQGTATTTLTPSLRGVSGGTFPTIAANGTAGTKGFGRVGATAWQAANGTLSDAADGTEFFIATPTILDLTLTALPASGLGAMRLTLVPIVTDLLSGQY